MYSGTVTPNDLRVMKLQEKVPDLEAWELVIGNGVAKVLVLPFEAPWLSSGGACLIKITDIRRGEDGQLEFQLADEKNVPYDDGTVWCKADEFFNEWPQ